MADGKDRLNVLLDPANTTLNGIDYVEIASADQKMLRVHFLNANPVATSVTGVLFTVTIEGGDTIASVPVLPIEDPADWSVDAAGRHILTLRVEAPGDFSIYTLRVEGARIDPFFSEVPFSFKALCETDLDCATPEERCPEDDTPPPPIDYLAKDYASFRKALLDFSALRYPGWQERSQADFGVMFLEALAALADELSYTQDRVSWEAALETATQRRSIVRLARLVDYEPRPETSARVLLQVDVTGAALPRGLPVSAQGPDGSTIVFETGEGLIHPASGQLATEPYAVDPAWNRGRLRPYVWDDTQLCLRRGAREMWIEGHGLNLTGALLLIDTDAAVDGDPPIRSVVRIAGAEEQEDFLFPTPPDPSTRVTRVWWGEEDALAHDHDLCRTTLAGNLVPATHGRTVSESFAVKETPAASPSMPLALERTGPNGIPLFLHSLRGRPLVWLAEDAADAVPQPEVVLEQMSTGPDSGPWTWRKRLLNAPPLDASYTVDPMRYSPVTRNSDGSWSFEYDGDEGATLRFGDGDFGQIPEHGAQFRVQYRVGGGVVGNVAADSITKVEPQSAPSMSAVTNPFAAEGGADEESDETVRRLAPQAFHAHQYRAVRPDDYEDAAETLSWVQRAGTAFRWTGSWLTAFTTADPTGGSALPLAQHVELVDLLNRYRMAGYESYVPAPRYVALDLIIRLCAKETAFRGDVEAAVLAQLSSERLPDGSLGFFHVDNFTFGVPLERSALAATVQRAHGVAGILSIKVRRRGHHPVHVPMSDSVVVGEQEIIRVDNDANRPEFGSLKVIVEGGK